MGDAASGPRATRCAPGAAKRLRPSGDARYRILHPIPGAMR